MNVEMNDTEWFTFWSGILLVLFIVVGIPACMTYNVLHDTNAVSFQQSK